MIDENECELVVTTSGESTSVYLGIIYPRYNYCLIWNTYEKIKEKIECNNMYSYYGKSKYYILKNLSDEEKCIKQKIVNFINKEEIDKIEQKKEKSLIKAIPKKELKLGYSYIAENKEEYIYLGKCNVTEVEKGKYGDRVIEGKEKKFLYIDKFFFDSRNRNISDSYIECRSTSRRLITEKEKCVNIESNIINRLRTVRSYCEDDRIIETIITLLDYKG